MTLANLYIDYRLSYNTVIANDDIITPIMSSKSKLFPHPQKDISKNKSHSKKSRDNQK